MREIGSAEHELPAFLAAAGSELHHVVGGANRVRIVLDDEHRVAGVAQAVQQPKQSVHVARVQADRRLVEHVERVDELRPERVRETDALRFAAGQRARRAMHRQIVQADVAEELHAIARFLENVRGDLPLERSSARASRATSSSRSTGSSLTSAIVRPATRT